jgi:hypothetical protein
VTVAGTVSGSGFDGFARKELVIVWHTNDERNGLRRSLLNAGEDFSISL